VRRATRVVATTWYNSLPGEVIMKKCSCGGNLVVEGIDDQRYKTTCQSCGAVDVQLKDGRRLLTGEDITPPIPPVPTRRVLVEEV